MDIYTILELRSDAEQEEVKSKYYKMLALLHPRTKYTGSEYAFMQLQDAYKKYLLGDDYLNCFMVCADTDNTVKCRCGGVYTVERGKLGRNECEFCSCFIFVQERVKKLSA